MESPGHSESSSQPAYPYGATPDSADRGSSSSSSQSLNDADRQVQYVVIAYEKACELIRHVRENKTSLSVRLQEAVIDMENALEALAGPGSLQERLAGLSKDEFKSRKELVRFACEEVIHFPPSSDLQDVKLQVLLPALRRRVSQLADC